MKCYVVLEEWFGDFDIMQSTPILVCVNEGEARDIVAAKNAMLKKDAWGEKDYN